MQAEGQFQEGAFGARFCPESSFGLLDWGRGVWTRDNTWYWAVAQGWQDGRRFGLNLGYGFGDTSAASENMVFIDGAAHKLHRGGLRHPREDRAARTRRRTADRYQLMQPWHMTDDEGRLDLVFTPLLDRVDWMDFKLIRSDQHQVFGRFDGAVTLDDGSTCRCRTCLALPRSSTTCTDQARDGRARAGNESARGRPGRLRSSLLLRCPFV